MEDSFSATKSTVNEIKRPRVGLAVIYVDLGKSGFTYGFLYFTV